MIPNYLLPFDATIEPHEGNTGIGPKYGTAVPTRCNLKRRRKKVKDAKGDELVSEAVAVLKPGTPVKPKDRFTCKGHTYEVLEVVDEPGAFGKDHHMVVTLK